MMQRRAIRDAKTPDKMKKSKAVMEDSHLSLQEKKEKIKLGLKKLTELGTVNPKNRYQDLINDVAKAGVEGNGCCAWVPGKWGAAPVPGVWMIKKYFVAHLPLEMATVIPDFGSGLEPGLT